MNLNCLTEHTPFSLIKRFGFASGKTSNKFDGFRCASRSKNNLVYLTRYTNSFFSTSSFKPATKASLSSL